MKFSDGFESKPIIDSYIHVAKKLNQANAILTKRGYRKMPDRDNFGEIMKLYRNVGEHDMDTYENLATMLQLWDQRFSDYACLCEKVYREIKVELDAAFGKEFCSVSGKQKDRETFAAQQEEVIQLNADFDAVRTLFYSLRRLRKEIEEAKRYCASKARRLNKEYKYNIWIKEDV